MIETCDNISVSDNDGPDMIFVYHPFFYRIKNKSSASQKLMITLDNNIGTQQKKEEETTQSIGNATELVKYLKLKRR